MNSFRRLFDDLPPDQQIDFVHRHLLPLLHAAPTQTKSRVLAAANDAHRRCARVPSLNLKAKKHELANILLELSRDSRRALIKERSRREQLLAEAVDSLAQWLNDIWRVVFEFRTHFALAHACLLFACEALEQISSGCGGCKCSYTSMFVPIHIRRSSGTFIRSFMLDGAHNLESVLLWIWRDLFMVILAAGSNHLRSIVPDMIDDIRIVLGWHALELLLRGGSIASSDDPPRQHLDIVDDDGDQNYISDDGSVVCDEDLYPDTFYAAHWSRRISSHQPRLRDLVHNVILAVFKRAPSDPLYSSLVAIADDPDELEEEIHPHLMSVAGHSSDNFAAAIRILSLNHRTDSIDALLKVHKHLLRPQDASSLQFAVLIMYSNFFYRAHAISIVQEELADIANVFRAAIRYSFCNIDTHSNKSELKQILALPRDSLTRRTRVERWVKGILTPQTDTSHPMALAALMIGIPLPPGNEGADDGDMLGYFDVDGDDPEVEDLKEEYRPNIKVRFQGWVDTAISINPALLTQVFQKMVRDMPFLIAKDVVEEMSARIADRPSKVHVSDALDAFREFCDQQMIKLVKARAKAKTKCPSESAPSNPVA